MARFGWKRVGGSAHGQRARLLWLAVILAATGLTGIARSVQEAQNQTSAQKPVAVQAPVAPPESQVAAPDQQETSAADAIEDAQIAATDPQAAAAEPDADHDGMPDAWEDFFGLNKNDPMDATGDLDGDGVLNLQEFQAHTHPNGKYHRYFAEGSTGFFTTSLGLFNPSATTKAQILLSFITEQGNVITKQVALDPRHRLTYSVNAALAPQIIGVSTHVESNVPVAADRFMRWGFTNYGSSLDSGAESPSTTWYFAEGATGNFALYYLLLNPGNTTAHISIKFLRESGAPITKTYTVGPHRRETVFVNLQDLSLLWASVGASITSDQPIVAERAMYLSSLFELFGAGGASAGSATLSKKWYFAEGATGPFFDEYILLVNPSTSTAADVEVTFRKDDGTGFVRHYTVAPSSRRTIWINQEASSVPSLAPLATGPVSVAINADQPIAAERSMWWARGTPWYEVHTSEGETTPGSGWMVAEAGFDGPTNDQTFLLISNTAATSGPVRVTMYKDDGTSAVANYTLAANSRKTVEVGPTFGLANDKVSLVIESLGATPLPIVVDYVRYSTTGFRLWNAGGAANAIKLPVIAPVDTAPTVTATTPAEGATNVDRTANLSVTFSESVNAAAGAFTLECPGGTPIPFTATASPATVFTIDPTAPLPISSACVLTVHASLITDADATDPPDVMASDVTVHFTTAACAAITITPTTLSPANVGAAYGPVQFLQSGGTAPITWSLDSGTLPTGMTLSATGALSGTPTASGSFTFTVKATDAGGCTGTITVTLSVSCPTITVSPSSLSPGNVGVAYGPVTFTQTGAPTAVTWSLTSGTLPAGMTLSAGGVLSGTPTASGSSTFTVTATDANGCTGAVTVTLSVSCPTITVLPTSLSPGNVGVAYGPVTFTQTGAPTAVTWSVTGGTLPAGMTLSAGGVLSGTPTASGSSTFTVTATDTNGCAGSVTVTLSVTCPTITVSPTSLTGATVGAAYGPVTFTQTGSPTAVTWSVTSGTLPVGMTLSAGGVLSGTPTVAGSSTFTVTATDTNGCTGAVTVTLSVTCPTITITPATLTGATVGVAYGPVTFTQTGSPTAVTYAVTAGALPAGMTLTAAGDLSGTPTVPGSYSFTVTATDANGCTGAIALTLSVTCPTITVTPTSVSAGTAGVAYAPVTFTQTGAPTAVTWSVSAGALPTGMTLSAGGVLSGTPTVTGTFTFTVKATDANGCAGTVSITLQINCPTITITPGTLTNATVGTAFGPVTFAHTGGVGTTTFAVTAGALPAGVTLSSAGVLSGTPTAQGTFTFTITATDANGCTGTVSITWTVQCPTITVTPASLTDALGGIPYSQPFSVSGGTVPHTWSISGTLPPGIGFNTGTHVLSGTPTQPGVFPLVITATDNYGCTGSSSPTLTVQANAINDMFPGGNVLGNVIVSSGAFSVLTNDVMGSSPTPTVTAFDATSANGGTVVMAANGTFTYEPPAGFEGTDTFNYTATAGSFSDTAQVSVTVSGMIWFIDASASCSPCSGRLSTPFKTLAAFTAINDGVDNVPGHSFHPANNDNIFLAESGSDYTGGITLRNGQKLIGQDATVALATIAGVTPHPNNNPLPAMNAANGTFARITGTGLGVVTLGTGNTLRGLRLLSGSASTVGLSGNGFGTVTVSEASIAGSGPAVNLQNGAPTATFASLASTGGATNGIVLTNTTGSLTVVGDGGGTNNGSGGTISGTTGHAVLLTNATSVSLNYMNITGAGAASNDVVNINEPKGTWSFNRNNLTNAPHNNVTLIMNAGTMSGFTMTNNVVSGAVGNSGMDFNFAGTSSTSAVTLTSNMFQNNFADALQIDTQDTAAVTSATIQNNTFTGNNIALDLDQNESGNVVYQVLNNSFQNHHSHAMNVFMGTTSTSTGVLQARIQGNTIGTTGVFDSGSAIGNAMRINLNADGRAIIAVNNNQVHEVPTARAIEVVRRLTTTGAAQVAEITITNNTVTAPTGTTQDVCGTDALCPLANYYVTADTSPAAINLNIVSNTGYNPSSFPLGAEATIRVREVLSGITQVQGSGAAGTQVTTNNPGAANVSVDAGVTTFAGPVVTPP